MIETLKPEIAKALDNLGAKHPTRADLIEDGQMPTENNIARTEWQIALSEEDRITANRIQHALDTMERAGYKFSPTYNSLRDLWQKIEEGLITGSAAAEKFLYLSAAASKEMDAALLDKSTDSPPKKRPFGLKLPGFLKGILGMKP